MRADCSLDNKIVVAVSFDGTYIFSTYDVPYSKYIVLEDNTEIEMNNTNGTLEMENDTKGIWYNNKAYKDRKIKLTRVCYYGTDGYGNCAFNTTAYVE